MAVHPRSIHAALHEYKQSTGGRDFPLNAATVAEIIAEVHAVAKRHQRSREIRLRMKAAAWAHEKNEMPPSPSLSSEIGG